MSIPNEPGVSPAASPVFIAGCGRSGTSYLRTIVDAHPDFFIPSESLFLVDYLRWGDALPKPLLSWLFFREPQLLCWYEGGPFRFDDAASAIGKIHEIEAQAHGARHWGQKTPRFINHMALFNAAFPGIRWLLIYRDPRGVAASMKDSKQHTYSLAKACHRWKRDNRAVLTLLRGETQDSQVLLVKFEDLVLEFEKTLSKVFDFLGVEAIDGDAINAHGRPVFFNRSRFSMNTTRGGLTPDPAIVDSWRTRLKPAEIAYIEGACAEEMRALGYRPVAATRLVRGAGLQVFRDAGILFRYLRNWPEYLFVTALRKALFGVFSVPSRLAMFFARR